MKRFSVAVVAISGCIIGPACQAIVGIEDRAEAPPFADASVPDTTASAEDGATDAQACPPGTSCVDPDAGPPKGCPTGCLPPAPDGWTGPSATYDGAESGKPASCPATYTQKEIDAHQGLNAPAASCACGAATVTGRMCTAGVSIWPGGCGIGLPTKIGTANTTTCFTTSGDASGWQVATPTLVPGTCTFPNATTTKTPPAFAKVDVACGLPQTSACADRADCIAAPIPDQPFGRRCIHKDGEHPLCPSADYPVRFVAYKGFDDTRACTTCTATPSGGACGSSTWFTRLKAQDCGDTLAVKGSDMTAGQCYSNYPGPGTLIDIYKMAPSAGTCTATGGAPSGTASSTQPVTFCCNE